jgi:hypothetical protein
LTAKKGLFWDVLAGKQGLGAHKKAFYFALFHVLMVFYVCKSLAGSVFPKIRRSQINRAGKPTVGFLFLGSCDIIAP